MIITIVLFITIECCLESKNLLGAVMLLSHLMLAATPRGISYHHLHLVNARPHSSVSLSLRPLLQPTVRNISVHTSGRFSCEGYRINPGLVERQILRTVKACGPKGKVLFSKERSQYNNVLFSTQRHNKVSKNFSEKSKNDIQYILYFDVKQILYTVLSAQTIMFIKIIYYKALK